MTMNLRHAAALALVTCVLSIPAKSPSSPSTFEFGIRTRAACEARLKELDPPAGWNGEKAHCECSGEPAPSKEVPKRQPDSH